MIVYGKTNFFKNCLISKTVIMMIFINKYF